MMIKNLLSFLVLLLLVVSVSAVDFYPSGNISMQTGNRTFTILNMSAASPCPVGFFSRGLDNNGSWICELDAGGSGSGDITSVQFDNILVYNGSESGIVRPVVNYSWFNNTVLYLTNISGFLINWSGVGDTDTDTNCSVDGSCSLLTYDAEFDNSSIVRVGDNSTVLVSWDNISGVPSGFSDGVDNDTTYDNSTGLNLIGTTFSIVLSYFQGLFIELTDSFGGDVYGTYDNLLLATNSVDDFAINYSDVTLADFSDDIGFFTSVNNFTGSLTDAKYCIWDDTNSLINCTSEGGSGSSVYGGAGIEINSSDNITLLLGYRVPQGCNDGEIAEYNTTSSGWDCGVDNTAASGMASWVLASEDTGGSESITDGETVTFADDDYLNATRVTNTITYSVNEVKLNATIDDRDSDTWNTTQEMINAVNNSGYYNISINYSNVLNHPADVDTDTHVASDGIYLYNDTSTMYFNETKLNATIDDRDTNTDTNASTACSGTQTYLDGEGNCDILNDLSNFSNSLGYFNDIANFTGTKTDTKICIWDNSNSLINCTYTDQTGGGSGENYWIDGGDYVYPNTTYADNVVVTGNLTNNGTRLYIGSSDVKQRIQFWDGNKDGGGYIQYDPANNWFESNTPLVWGSSAQFYTLYSSADIFTTGSGDDFWLGAVSQASSNFRAYATGALEIGGGKFNISPTGIIASTNLAVADCDLKAYTNGTIYCGTDADTGGVGASKWIDEGNYLQPNATFGNNVNVVGYINATDWSNITITESQISDLVHTTDTNASTACSGTTTYLDGEGNCDNLDVLSDFTNDVGYYISDDNITSIPASKITTGTFGSGDYVINGGLNVTNRSIGGCTEVWNGTCSIKTCPTTVFVQC